MNEQPIRTNESSLNLTEAVDARRIEVNNGIGVVNKSIHGQFMTPAPIARFMASLFRTQEIGKVKLLDAGAGIGSLTAAFIEDSANRTNHTSHISATAYEIDPILVKELKTTLSDCNQICEEAGINFLHEIIQRDFIIDGANQIHDDGVHAQQYTHAILNPPYKKIHSESNHRLQLRSVSIETSNLYTGFLAIAIKLLKNGGELVAITPRSFCNGPYFKTFRRLLLQEMCLVSIHTFESRTDAFRDDKVLQENIILYATKGQPQGSIRLSISQNADLSHMRSRMVNFSQLVNPDDKDSFIHIITNEEDQRLVDRMMNLPCTLDDLGIGASTGPVVDFRLKEYLRNDPEPNTVPLIYPTHCKDNFVKWPLRNSKKPNAIVDCEPVEKWLYPNGHYVVVRRFSSKEERRRVTAAIHDARDIPGEKIGFENHVNVFHSNKQGLTAVLARGLAFYLNSTFYDICFRQFNGHTQVNVRDLYNLRYPDVETLETFGRQITNRTFPTQEQIDELIERELF